MCQVFLKSIDYLCECVNRNSVVGRKRINCLIGEFQNQGEQLKGVLAPQV